MTYGIEDIALILFMVMVGIVASMMIIRGMITIYDFDTGRSKKDYILSALFLEVIAILIVYYITPYGRDIKLIVCTALISSLVPMVYRNTRYVCKELRFIFKVRQDITKRLINPIESWLDPNGVPYGIREPEDKEQK